MLLELPASWPRVCLHFISPARSSDPGFTAENLSLTHPLVLAFTEDPGRKGGGRTWAGWGDPKSFLITAEHCSPSCLRKQKKSCHSNARPF